jgi:hypothetical protein
MAILEYLGGFILGLLSLLILILRSLIAFGDMGRYFRAKTM